MSKFLGTTSGTAGVGIQHAANDIRLWPQWADNDAYTLYTVNNMWELDGYRSPWWPGNGGMDASGNELLVAVWQDRMEVNSGAVAKVVFTGITRDVYGSILGSCVVKLFKSADATYPGSKDAKIDETTSDATTGYFTLYSPYYPDTHFFVMYKAGSPDVFGSSPNTLIGI